MFDIHAILVVLIGVYILINSENTPYSQWHYDYCFTLGPHKTQINILYVDYNKKMFIKTVHYDYNL